MQASLARLVVQLAFESLVLMAVANPTALFMTVWHRRSRNAESSCGIRPD